MRLAAYNGCLTNGLTPPERPEGFVCRSSGLRLPVDDLRWRVKSTTASEEVWTRARGGKGTGPSDDPPKPIFSSYWPKRGYRDQLLTIKQLSSISHRIPINGRKR
jgi:hypothetical protein